MATDGTQERIEHARQGLDDKLAEVERRVEAAKQALNPNRILESPWFQAGLAVTVGFAAGFGRDSGVLRAGVRLLLAAGARRLLNDALERVR